MELEYISKARCDVPDMHFTLNISPADRALVGTLCAWHPTPCAASHWFSGEVRSRLLSNRDRQALHSRGRDRRTWKPGCR